MSYQYIPDFHELWPKSEAQLLLSKEKKQDTFSLINNPENKSLPAIILPDLYCYLVIHILQSGTIRCRLIGPRTKAISVNRKKRSRSLIFKLPGPIFHQVIGIPIQKLTDRSYDAADIIGTQFQEEAISLIQTEQYEKLSTAFIPKNTLNNQEKVAGFLLHTAINSPNHIKVAQLAKQLGWSSRYLRKIAQKHLGMSPKMVQKIGRLQHSLAIKMQNTPITYSHLAIEAGYYDQSHMIADYQTLLGHSPGILFD